MRTQKIRLKKETFLYIPSIYYIEEKNWFGWTRIYETDKIGDIFDYIEDLNSLYNVNIIDSDILC